MAISVESNSRPSTEDGDGSNLYCLVSGNTGKVETACHIAAQFTTRAENGRSFGPVVYPSSLFGQLSAPPVAEFSSSVRGNVEAKSDQASRLASNSPHVVEKLYLALVHGIAPQEQIIALLKWFTSGVRDKKAVGAFILDDELKQQIGDDPRLQGWVEPHYVREAQVYSILRKIAYPGQEGNVDLLIHAPELRLIVDDTTTEWSLRLENQSGLTKITNEMVFTLASQNQGDHLLQEFIDAVTTIERFHHSIDPSKKGIEFDSKAFWSSDDSVLPGVHAGPILGLLGTVKTIEVLYRIGNLHFADRLASLNRLIRPDEIFIGLASRVNFIGDKGSGQGLTPMTMYNPIALEDLHSFVRSKQMTLSHCMFLPGAGISIGDFLDTWQTADTSSEGKGLLHRLGSFEPFFADDREREQLAVNRNEVSVLILVPDTISQDTLPPELGTLVKKLREDTKGMKVEIMTFSSAADFQVFSPRDEGDEGPPFSFNPHPLLTAGVVCVVDPAFSSNEDANQMWGQHEFFNRFALQRSLDQSIGGPFRSRTATILIGEKDSPGTATADLTEALSILTSSGKMGNPSGLIFLPSAHEAASSEGANQVSVADRAYTAVSQAIDFSIGRPEGYDGIGARTSCPIPAQNLQARPSPSVSPDKESRSLFSRLLRPDSSPFLEDTELDVVFLNLYGSAKQPANPEASFAAKSLWDSTLYQLQKHNSGRIFRFGASTVRQLKKQFGVDDLTEIGGCEEVTRSRGGAVYLRIFAHERLPIVVHGGGASVSKEHPSLMGVFSSTSFFTLIRGRPFIAAPICITTEELLLLERAPGQSIPGDMYLASDIWERTQAFGHQSLVEPSLSAWDLDREARRAATVSFALPGGEGTLLETLPPEKLYLFLSRADPTREIITRLRTKMGKATRQVAFENPNELLDAIGELFTVTPYTIPLQRMRDQFSFIDVTEALDVTESHFLKPRQRLGDVVDLFGHVRRHLNGDFQLKRVKIGD